MSFGIELRQRSRSGGSAGDYARLVTEAEDLHDDEDSDFGFHSPSSPDNHGWMRKRRPRSRSEDDYLDRNYEQQGEEEDEDDEEVDEHRRPLLRMNNRSQRIKFVPEPSSNACAKLCVILSFLAIIFLGIISFLLASNSPYIHVSAENKHRKVELAKSVDVAILLYFISMVTSCYFLWRSHYRTLNRNDARFVD